MARKLSEMTPEERVAYWKAKESSAAKANTSGRRKTKTSEMTSEERVAYWRDKEEKEKIGLDTFETDLGKLSDELVGLDGWRDQDTMTGYGKSVADMLERANAYKSYYSGREDNYDSTGIDDVIKWLNDANEIVSRNSEAYGAYDSADAYNAAVKKYADREKEFGSLTAEQLKALMEEYLSGEWDTKSKAEQERLQKEIDKIDAATADRVAAGSFYANPDSFIDWRGVGEWIRNLKFDKDRQALVAEYNAAGDKNQDDRYTAMQYYYWKKLAEELGTKGYTSRQTLDGIDITTDHDLFDFSVRWSDDEIKEYINNIPRHRAVDEHQKITADKREATGYHTLTDDEKSLYLYLADNVGKEAAKEYFDYLFGVDSEYQLSISSRAAQTNSEAKSDFERVIGSFGVGLQTWGSGFKKAVNSLFSDEAIPMQVWEKESAYDRQALSDSAVGGALYDIGVSVGNMAPSILTAYLTAGIGGAAGLSKAAISAINVGTSAVTFGVPIYGNAYNEARLAGAEKGAAMSYAALTAASEVALEKLIGGIPGIGKALDNGILTTLTNRVSNVLLKLSARVVDNALGEFTEEYLQEILGNVFRNLCLGENNEIKLVSEEALYSGIIGALTSAGLNIPNAIATYAGLSSTGKVYNGDLAKVDGVKGLIELGLAADSESEAHKYAALLQQEIDQGKSPTNAKVGMLASILNEAVEDGEIDAAKGLEMSSEEKAGLIKDAFHSYKYANDAKYRNEVEASREYTETSLEERMETAKKILSLYEESGQLTPELEQKVMSYALAGEEARGGAESVSVSEREGNATNAPQGANLAAVAGETSVQSEAERGPWESQKAEDYEATVEKLRGREAELPGKSQMAAVYDAENASRSDNARQNADVYAAEYKMVRQLAEMGTKVETVHRMINGSYGGEMTLTEDQFAAAYREGRDAAAANSRENEEIDKRISEGARRKQGKVYFNGAQGVKTAQGVLFLPASGIDSDWARSKTLSEEQKAAIRFAKNVLSKYGVDVVFYSSAKNKSLPNGLYDGKRIYIDIEAGMSDSTQESLVMYAIAHELTHMAERLSPELWQRYAGAVMEILAEREGVSVSELIARKQNEHEAAGVAILRKTYSESEKTSDELHAMVEPLSEKGAIREIVADASQLILTRKGGLAEELAKKDAGLWGKIKELVIKAIRRMQEVFRGVPRDGVSEHLVNHLDELAVYFNEMMADTLYRAGYQERAKTTSAESNSKTGGEVQFSHARRNANKMENANFREDKYFGRQINDFESLKQGSYITVGEIIEGSPLNKVGIPFGKLYFDVSKIIKEMKGRKDAIPVEVIKEIPKVLEDPIVITEYVDRSGIHSVNVYGKLYVGSSPVVIGIMVTQSQKGTIVNKIQTVHPNRNAVKEMTDDNILYLSENKKETKLWFQSLGTQTLPLGGNKFGFIKSISQNPEKSTPNAKVPENSNNAQLQIRRGALIENEKAQTQNRKITEGVSDAERSGKSEKERISMADFVNRDSSIWRNIEYENDAEKAKIMQDVHKAMVEDGAVVTVPYEVLEAVSQSFPDLRGVKKKERTPLLKEAMSKLKSNIRRFLDGFKNKSFEFEVSGKVLEAKLYNTGINEVMEKITQNKANMLYATEQIFQNARYLYSTPDYDGDPNVYRWNYFYTPVRIGEETVGVRIAIRDTANPAESQIYNWGIKKDATLGGLGRGTTDRISHGASSDASNNSIPQKSDLSTENSKISENSNNVQAQNRRIDPETDRQALAEVAQAAARSAEDEEIARAYAESLDEYREMQKELNEIHDRLQADNWGEEKLDGIERRRLLARQESLEKALESADSRLLQMEAMTPFRNLVGRESKRADDAVTEAAIEKQLAKDQKTKAKERATRTQLLARAERAMGRLYRWTAKPNKKEHVPSELLPLVKSLFDVVEVSHNFASIEKLQERLGEVQGRISELQGRGAPWSAIQSQQELAASLIERIRKLEGTRHNLTWADRLGTLKNIMSSVEGNYDVSGIYISFAPGLAEQIDGHLKTFTEKGGRVRLFDASLEDLRFYTEAIESIAYTIAETGRLYANKRGAALATLGENSILRFQRERQYLERSEKVRGIVDMYGLDALNPAYFARKLGAEAESVMGELFEGFYATIENVRVIDNFSEELRKRYKVESFTGKNERLHTFSLERGGSVTLTTSQLMTVYALSERPQGKQHLYGQGIQPFAGDIQEAVRENTPKLTRIKDELGRIVGKGSADLSEYAKLLFGSADVHGLTEKDVKAMIEALDTNQKECVKEIKTFLRDVIAPMGNKTSQKLYLYDAFTEENYFPIETVKTFIALMEKNQKDGDIDTRSVFAVLNQGFTKQLDPKAANPIVIRGIFDVFMEHCFGMANYGGMGVAVSDTIKWLNYKRPVLQNENSQTSENAQRRRFIEKLDDATSRALERLSRGELISAKEIEGLKEVKEGIAQAEALVDTFLKNHPEFREIPRDQLGTYLLQDQERLALREKILEERSKEGSFSYVDKNGKEVYNGDVEQGKRIDIVVGLPASGKSSAIVNPLSEFYHSMVIDSDIIKQMLPEYHEGVGASLVHSESGDINFELLKRMLKKGNNVVLPIVGARIDSVEEYIKLAKQGGYSVHLHLNELPGGKAIGRMLNRYFETGRFINPTYAVGYGNKPTEVYQQLIERKEIDGYSRWNNDVARGERPKLRACSKVEAAFSDFSGNWRATREGSVEEGNRGVRGREQDEVSTEAVSVRSAMQGAYGMAAERYIKNLLMSIEGELKGTDGARVINQLIRNAKIASVAANPRVVLQQPTAYVRAGMVLSAKNLARALKPHRSYVQEAIEKNALMYYKSLGFYDMNTSRSLLEKMKGNATGADRIREAATWAAGKADEVTWGNIWLACRYEIDDYIREKKLDIKRDSDEYFELVNKKFNEVINFTQVIDSPMHKNKLMSDPDTGMKQLTAFMAEPMLTYNMVISATEEARKGRAGGKKKLAKASVIYLLQMALVAASSAIADVGRDDDEDETLLEKYGQAVLRNALGVDLDSISVGEILAGDWNILNNLPIVKEGFSLLEGYDPSRMDVSGIEKAVSAITKAYKLIAKAASGEQALTWKNAEKTLYSVAQAISTLTGIPVSNLWRLVRSLINTFSTPLL